MRRERGAGAGAQGPTRWRRSAAGAAIVGGGWSAGGMRAGAGGLGTGSAPRASPRGRAGPSGIGGQIGRFPQPAAQVGAPESPAGGPLQRVRGGSG